MPACDRTVLIVNARMASTRLPGKAMLDLAGAPMLARIFERVTRCRAIDEIVFATTTRPDDDCLVELARGFDLAVYRGAENDLIDRLWHAAVAHRAGIVVRLPADNPVAEPAEIDRLAVYQRGADVSFSSTIVPILGNGYPDGIGAEAMPIATLEEVWRTETDPMRREHLNLNFFDYGKQIPLAPGRFTVGTVPCPAAFSRPDLVLDVNTADEYAYMSALWRALWPLDPNFHITDVIRWHDASGELGERRTGKARSYVTLPAAEACP